MSNCELIKYFVIMPTCYLNSEPPTDVMVITIVVASRVNIYHCSFRLRAKKSDGLLPSCFDRFFLNNDLFVLLLCFMIDTGKLAPGKSCCGAIVCMCIPGTNMMTDDHGI